MYYFSSYYFYSQNKTNFHYKEKKVVLLGNIIFYVFVSQTWDTWTVFKVNRKYT
jgi:hypothetical protein